jgi:glycerol uptake facilitator-like aquaporin
LPDKVVVESPDVSSARQYPPEPGATISIFRRTAAETIGIGFLLAAVVGSRIMAESLASGNVALALLANSIATGAALLALILTFGPVAGVHMNRAITLAGAIRSDMPWCRGTGSKLGAAPYG